MCEYTAASYRLGTIVESVDNSGSQNQLSIADAQHVGRKINSRLSEYLVVSTNIMEAALSSTGSKPGADLQLTYDQNRTRLSARFDPGLILDFPKVTVTLGDKTIEVRSCVTVCVGIMRSKLWTRANTLSDWGEMSRDELESIHDILKKICEGINAKFRSMYEEDFLSIISSTQNIAVHGKIHVFAADCSGNDVAINLKELNSSISSKRDEIRSVEEPELASALHEITGILMHETPERSGDQKFLLTEDAEFFPMQSASNCNSVFVQQTAESNAYFAGLVDASCQNHLENSGSGTRTPNSVGATAELAAFFGSAF